MQADRQQARAFALLGLVMIFWAGNSIVGRAVRFDVPPLTLAFVRWTGALLVLAPFAVRHIRRDWVEIVKGWKAILLLGLLGIGAFNALLYSGLRYTEATNALLLQSAVPALVVILDRLIFGVRSTWLERFGVAASIVGVLVVVFEGDPARALRLHFGPGDILVLASVVVWAFYTVFLRLRPPISAVSFVATTFAIGVVTMGPLSAWELASGQDVHFSAGVAGAFLYVALFPSLISYFIYNHATRVVGAARAGQSITMMPIFGAFLSALLLGEALHGYHFVGMVLILAGIALGVLAARAKQAAGAGAEGPLEGRA